MKNKRLLSLVLVVMMVFSVIPATVMTFSAANEYVAQTGITGSGTEKDPYIVNTAGDLYSLFHSDKNMHVKLGQDISITSSVYVESDIVIDMNGKTITADVKSYGFNITKGHSLKITGSGKFIQKGTKLWAMFCVEGTLETHGTVTYECPDDSGCPINLSGYGIVRVYGGNFKGKQIAINGGSKMLVYGGSIASEVLVTKATQLYVYDGTFESRIYNYGYLYTFGGEFKKDVSSLGEYGEAIFWGGHFKEGVSNYSTSETGGKHLLGKNALCIEHRYNSIADDGVYIKVEISVFRPDYAEQTPEIKYNETEYDLGTINSLEEFIVSFKAKDVPKIFADNGYTIEEKLVVKDSDGFVETYDIKSGTKGQGVKLNLGNLTGGDYTVERTINLYKGSSLEKSNKCIMKITVNPMSSSLFGFATMNPAVSAEDMEDNYTDLPAIPIGTQTLDFGFTPFISTALSDKGFSAKPKVYINYNNQGTIKTLNSCKTFNLMDYVDRTGDYQVWFNINLYNGEEFVTSITHIYNVPIVLYDVNSLKANVTAPVAGALPDNTVTPAGEGYKTTDVDWSYYDEKSNDYYIMPDGMIFEAGKTYECAVQFEALDEYTFPENKTDINGYINGIQGVISSVYYKDKAYVTVRFTVPEEDTLSVIFTSDSKAQAGQFLEVDFDKMAELAEEFFEAVIEDHVKYQWFRNGSKIEGATSSRFDIPEDFAGEYLYVEITYEDKFIESDNLLIAEGNTAPTEPAPEDMYFTNPDWGKTEEDIIKAVEYTLNEDGTYSADIIVDVDCFDGQVYYYDVEGLGYCYYDHNNKFHSGAVGGAITKPAQEEIRFQIASDLQPDTQWRAKVYLAHDVYADYEIQGYEFSWIDLTVPAIPEATDATENTDPTETTQGTENTDPTETTQGTENTDPTETTQGTESTDPTEPATDNLYFTNPDWGKTEEDIIKAVEYTLNEDGTYTATVIVDVDCFDGQVYYYDVEGLGYCYYDHNNKLYSGAVGGAITKPAQEEIRFQIASDLQPGTQWRAKVYLAHDVYADYEIQGYEFSWVDLTVPNLPEPDVKGLLGDANEDGKVNVKDATAIQKHIANLITLTETGEKLADTDENTKVNIKDATAIQKFVAGLPVGNKIGDPVA